MRQITATSLNRAQLDHSKLQLPEKLVKQLNRATVADKVLKVITLAGGSLNLNEIMVAIYQVYEDIPTRASVNGALSKLRQTNQIETGVFDGEYTLVDRAFALNEDSENVREQ
jgi:hypothetical protein